MKRIAILLSLLACLVPGACRAGPSAFDDGAPDSAQVLGPEDTADVSSLPQIPRAPEVEPALEDSVAESDSVEEVELDVPGADTLEHRFPRPDAIRGLYVNAWAAGSSRRMDALLALADTTEINTFVIDIKDASGYVSHATAVPLAREIGATEEIRIRRLPALLTRLEESGIYPIARIVIVKDPLLTAARPELAVQDTAGGPWVDGKGIVWLNPFHRAVWDYHVALAREVAEMGFPEIQWDYVRFPDAPRSDLERAVFPGQDGRTKAEAIRALLDHTRESLSDLDVRVTADVFGVTTSASRDVGIGQVWESFIDVVDAALPMVYPSHYWEGSFGIDTPNAYPYEVVRNALEDALERSEEVEGAGATRPWLQDFTLGEPVYGVPEVRAQIQATYDVGIEDWILWNPGSRYTEGALEPVDGFQNEPMMRIAARLVPVSRRMEVLDSVAAAEAEREAAEARADSLEAWADSLEAEADSLAAAPDSLASVPDSTAGGR